MRILSPGMRLQRIPRRAWISAALVSALACSLGVSGCATASGPAKEMRAPAQRHDPVAGSDTFFVHRRVTANDSFYVFVTVDERGDTLSFRLRQVVDANEHLRTWGPYTNSAADKGRHFAEHRIEWTTPGMLATNGDDFCTEGSDEITNLRRTVVYQTEAGAHYERSWRYANTTTHRDTLDIVQNVWGLRDRPWLRVRYDITLVSQGAKSDSIRFLWKVHSVVGPDRSKHDVGWVYGYGPVFHNHVFEAGQVGYAAYAINIGNPRIRSEASSYKDPALEGYYGSGGGAWLSAGFMWKADEDIVPMEIAFIDTTEGWIPSLDSDSLNIHTDTTSVYGHGQRWIYARTPWYVFETGDTRSCEFVVFRGFLLADLLPPAWPDITWSDDTLARPPDTSKQR